MNVADPVGIGLVKSLVHPGGTATGFATIVPEGFVGKELELLKAVVPKASRLASLMNPENQIHARERAKFAEYGRQLRVELIVVEASKPDEYDAACEAARNKLRRLYWSWETRLLLFTQPKSPRSLHVIIYQLCICT
jgi:ABC-type uncharacterized transport system substrate-binding protein